MEENLELNIKVNKQEAEQALDSLKDKAEDVAQAVEDIGDKTEEGIEPINNLGNAFEGVFQNAVQDAGKLNGTLGDVFKAVKQGIPTIRSLNNTVLAGLTGIKAALAGLGIGIIISGITLLTSKLVELVKKTQDAKKATDDLTSAAADQIVQFTILSRKFQEVGKSEEAQKKFIVDHKTEIENLGLAINDVNTANRVFIDDTEKYVEAFKERAKAAALYNIMVETTKTHLEDLATVHNDLEEAESGKRTFWQRLVEGAILSSNATYSAAQAEAVRAKQMEENIQGISDSEISLKEEYNKTMNDLFDQFVEATKKADEVLGTFSNSGKKSAKELYEAWAKANPEKVIAGEYAVQVWENQIKKEGQKARELAEIRERLGQPIANTDVEVEEETIQDVLKRNQTRKEAELAFQKELLDIELLPAREKNNQLYALEQERLESRKTYLQSLMSLELEDSDKRKEYADEILDIDNELALVNAKRIEQEKKDIAEEIQIYTTAVQSLADIFGTIAEMEEERIQRMVDQGQITEEQAKRQFEVVKAWQYSQTWINTLAGMTAALTAPIMQSTPAGWIAAAAQAASLLAQGIAQTAKIKNTQFGGGSTGGGVSSPNVGVTPLKVINDVQKSPVVPVEKVNPEDQRVWILQSDLEDSHRQVEIRESNSTF